MHGGRFFRKEGRRVSGTQAAGQPWRAGASGRNRPCLQKVICPRRFRATRRRASREDAVPAAVRHAGGRARRPSGRGPSKTIAASLARRTSLHREHAAAVQSRGRGRRARGGWQPRGCTALPARPVARSRRGGGAGHHDRTLGRATAAQPRPTGELAGHELHAEARRRVEASPRRLHRDVVTRACDAPAPMVKRSTRCRRCGGDAAVAHRRVLPEAAHAVVSAYGSTSTSSAALPVYEPTERVDRVLADRHGKGLRVPCAPSDHESPRACGRRWRRGRRRGGAERAVDGHVVDERDGLRFA